MIILIIMMTMIIIMKKKNGALEPLIPGPLNTTIIDNKNTPTSKLCNAQPKLSIYKQEFVANLPKLMKYA